MRMMSTTPATKYRFRIISAIRLCVGLPKPIVRVLGKPSILTLIWIGGNKLFTIIQNTEQPALFACKSFHHFLLESSLDVDLEALDGPPLLMEFLNAVADWLA